MSCSGKLYSSIRLGECSELGESNVTEAKRKGYYRVSVSNDTLYCGGWRQRKKYLDLLFRGNFFVVIGAEGQLQRVKK